MNLTQAYEISDRMDELEYNYMQEHPEYLGLPESEKVKLRQKWRSQAIQELQGQPAEITITEPAEFKITYTDGNPKMIQKSVQLDRNILERLENFEKA